eukprot:scaffold302315_cov27-Tisochrysis_lutea.AAC.2
MDVSARMVATTTLRAPSRGESKISRCSAVGMRECRGSTRRSRAAVDEVSRFTISAISAQPGTNTRTAPSSRWKWMCNTVRTTRSKSTSSAIALCAAASCAAMAGVVCGSAAATPAGSSGTPGSGPSAKAEGARCLRSLGDAGGKSGSTSSKKSSSMG